MLDVTEIKVGLARIEEQLKSQQAQLDKLASSVVVTAIRHDLDAVARNIRELETTLTKKVDELRRDVPTVTDYDNLEARVTKLESNQSWVIRMVVGAVMTAILGLIGLKMKFIGG